MLCSNPPLTTPVMTPSLPQENTSGPFALLDPDHLGVYLIRAWLHTLSLPYPWYWLGQAGYLSPTSGLGSGGLIPRMDPPNLDGLPLTHEDLCTHRSPFPLSHKVGSIDHPHLMSAEDQRTRSQTAIFTGSTSIAAELPHGRPQWVRRVRHFSISFAWPVSASEFGPPRLHDAKSSYISPHAVPPASCSKRSHRRGTSVI